MTISICAGFVFIASVLARLGSFKDKSIMMLSFGSGFIVSFTGVAFGNLYIMDGNIQYIAFLVVLSFIGSILNIYCIDYSFSIPIKKSKI